VSSRIVLPVAPQQKERAPFPLIATLAPVVVGVVLVVVTGSLISLAFAVLGPVIAVATLADGRRSRTRSFRKASAQFWADVDSTQERIRAAHADERAQLWQRHPGALSDPRWDDSAEVSICIGVGEVTSDLECDEPPTVAAGDRYRASLDELAQSATTVADAPVVVEFGNIVTVVGRPTVARPLFRSVVLQLAGRLSPATHTIVTADVAEPWLARLPHAVGQPASTDTSVETVMRGCTLRDRVSFVSRSGERAVVQLADEPVGVAGTILRVSPDGVTLSQPTGDAGPRAQRADSVAAEEAAAWAERARSIAERLGIGVAGAALPASVDFGDLTQTDTSLTVTLGAGSPDPLTIDLVTQGPHAVIGGTTGSGKSELLVTWLLGLAAQRPPSSVSFLLFDFKGGTSFGAVPTLPHCVGTVTDLDARMAKRALESVTAELRYRERQLADAGARSIDDDAVAFMPRLVVVIDEFAHLAETFPDLYAVLADVAARGRSLGIHLILCTQRPAGVVRDAVMANIGLRISLRVTNTADSIAVLGADDAARLAGQPIGRACVAQSGHSVATVQVALASASDVGAVAERWSAAEKGRRPWLDPLPAVVEQSVVLDAARTAHVDETHAFGLLDLPADQSQPASLWNPVRDGSLVVLGGTSSGKTGALAAVAAHRAACWVPPDVESAWDLICAPPTDTLMVVDDLDLLLARLGTDYERETADRLIAIARDPHRRLAVSAQRLAGCVHLIAQECESRLLLRLSGRQEHLIAGGTAADFDPTLPPGGGVWRGARVQVMAVDPPRSTVLPSSTVVEPNGPTIAVTNRPTQFSDLAIAAGHRVVELANVVDDDQTPAFVVGDPESWQNAYSLLTRLRAQGGILFHGCSLADVRSISRVRDLPPPLADPSRGLWFVHAGTIQRATFSARTSQRDPAAKAG
jgi:DNA segregation ATPase FtsK/SpoIIIE, S-DNA-T family